MNEDATFFDPPELRFFEENQRRIPLEYLLPFVDQHVAWSLDGTRILASGDSMAAVEEKLVAAGIDPSRVVFSYVHDPDVAQL